MKDDIIAAFVPDLPVDDEYCKVIAKIESSNNPLAKAPTSSASGLYQFINGTWLDMFERYAKFVFSESTRQEILDMRFDPAISLAVFKCFTDENRNVLIKSRIEPTNGNLYLAHFLGAGGARRALTAIPEDTVEKVMGSKVVHANPFLKDKTIQWLIDWADRKTKVN